MGVSDSKTSKLYIDYDPVISQPNKKIQTFKNTAASNSFENGKNDTTNIRRKLY